MTCSGTSWAAWAFFSQKETLTIRLNPEKNWASQVHHAEESCAPYCLCKSSITIRSSSKSRDHQCLFLFSSQISHLFQGVSLCLFHFLPSYTLDSWPHLSAASEDVQVHARHTSVHILLLHPSHSQAKILQQFVQVQGWAQLRLCLVYAWYLQRASNHLWCPLLCSQFPLSSLSLLLTLWYRRQYLTFERMLAFSRRSWGLPHRGTGHGMVAHCSLYDIP